MSATTKARANSRRPRDKTSGRYVTKFTDEAAQQIVDVIRAGNYIETAAAYAGVHKDTFYEWMKQGRHALAMTASRRSANQRRLADFVADVDQAVAAAEVRDLAIIGAAAPNAWQAAAWRLERKHPEKYSRRERVEMTGADGGPVEVANVEGAAERLRQKLAPVIELRRTGDA